MTSHRWVAVAKPWSAVLDADTPAPARLYTAISGQALRYGLPATRRPAAAWIALGRVGLPERVLASALRRLPARARPDLDAVLDAAVRAWPQLVARSSRLPARAPERPTALVLERRAARTVFLFGDDGRPLVVLKLPHLQSAGAAREAQALERAAGTCAPAYLGRVGEAFVQEALPGVPLRVVPLSPADAAVVRPPQELADAAAQFVRLAAATSTSGCGMDVFARAAVEEAIAHPSTSRALAPAWRDVRRARRGVLCHCDTSPQNLLVHDRRLTGLIDWETAVDGAAPGMDTFIAGLSWVEGGLGLRRFDDEVVMEAFRYAVNSPYWAFIRAKAREAVVAAGLPEAAAEPIEVVLLGIRLGRRLQRPDEWKTSARAAADALTAVGG